jgi:hypothetical protein
MKGINIDKMRKDMELAEQLIETQDSIKEQIQENLKDWNEKYFYQIEKYVGEDHYGIDMWDVVAHVNTDTENIPYLALDYVNHFCIFDKVRIFKCERTNKQCYSGKVIEKWDFKKVRNEVFEPILK